MARKISQLTPATLPLPGSTTLFLTSIADQSFNVSLNQLRTNAVFTGTLTIPTPLTSSNSQDAASTSWVRTYTSSLTFPITQGGTGATSASQARTNLSVPSITDLATKLDHGNFLSINNSDRLRITSTNASNPSLDIFRDGGLTFYHGNNSAQPVPVTTYQRPSSTERGLSIPLIKCSGGRFDFDPLDDKAEVRVTGALTAFNIYNTTQDLLYFSIGADRAAQFYNNVTAAGRVICNSTVAATSKVTGSAVFAGGIGVAGAIFSDSLSLTNALSIANGGTGATSASAARTALGVNPATAQYNASQLRGQNINSTTPTTNQALIYRSGEWQARSVIQTLSIQQSTTSTFTSITSATFTATPLTLTITPRSASSRFKIYVNISGIAKGGADTWLKAELRRGGTSIGVITGTAGFTASTATIGPGSCSLMILDTPATASAVTYTVFVANQVAGSTLTTQSNGETSSLIIEEYEV
jgi:hypothetical protein